MLSKIHQEGSFGQIGQGHFLALPATYFCPGCKLLIEDDTPLEIFHRFPYFSCRIDLTELAKGDGYFFFLVILPEYDLASLADSDCVRDGAFGGSRLSGKVGVEEGLIAGPVVALAEGEDGQLTLLLGSFEVEE